MKQPKNHRGIIVFYSYASADKDLRDQLANHLIQLKRDGLISEWHDQQILAGSDRDQAIDQAIHSAHLILLLVSSDFLASDVQYHSEMKQALERHERSEARVIPIIMRPCDWQHSPFARLQHLPHNSKPITTWNNQDAAFVNVATGIRRTIEEQLALSGVSASATLQALPTPVQSNLHRSRNLLSALPIGLVLIVVLGLLFALWQALSPLSRRNETVSNPTTHVTTTTLPTVTSSGSSFASWRTTPLQPLSNCNYPEGVGWRSLPTMGTYVCNASNLQIQKTSNAGMYAELDLDNVDNRVFNPTSFRIQVKVTYLDPDISTAAALFVQIQETSKSISNCVFALESSARLAELYFSKNGENPLVKAPTDTISVDQFGPGTPVPSSPLPPLVSATMEVEVQNGILKGFVNQRLGFERNFGSSLSSSVFGLIVFTRSPQPSKIVQFSDFQTGR